MNHQLESPFAKQIESYVAFKRSTGLQYHAEESQLRQFDSFCVLQEVKSLELTEKLFRLWTDKRIYETDKTHVLRKSALRQFAVYLRDNGVNAIVPPESIRGNSTQYVPYIFTDNEIKAIFAAADELKFKKVSPYVHLVFPTVLRVLYCCGLRCSEAITLKKENVSLDSGVLTILGAKNDKDRLVPISRSLQEYLRSYSEKMSSLNIASEFFFPNKLGDAIGLRGLYEQFRKCLFNAGIPHRGRGHGPRIHDFRHTFSVNCLRRMVEKGVDLYSALPVLSVYLGHKNVYATEKYLRMTAEVHPEIISQLETAYGRLLPAMKENEK